MNNYTRAAVWARFMAGALANPENARDYSHISEYVARCVRAADIALAEAIKRSVKEEVKL
jgi:hypothetical protein